MSVRALDVIRDEHRALAGMLASLRTLVRDWSRRGAVPDLGVLRAMLFYIHAYPERLHHPKETGLLFAAMRAREAEVGDLLDRLDAEHARGDEAVMRLAMGLIEVEQLGATRLASFADGVEHYVESYLRHMEIEERFVLPVAERILADDDWTRIDAAFAGNRDPLTGHPPEETFRTLFSRIVSAAPAPVGLGAPLRPGGAG
ncbi:MAG: hemerythrin domain-containing protein [Burkholderiales bacterium]|nr:MAG: hemerythrin domain-containing protein [Burkholderiales bacterium]